VTKKRTKIFEANGEREKRAQIYRVGWVDAKKKWWKSGT